MSQASLSELRSYMLGETTSIEPRGGANFALFESVVRELLLNEAYFGKGDIAPIEKVMCKIEAKILANPTINLYNEPESKELDDALCKVFGFKSAHVYWSCDPRMRGIGPCTLPAAKIFGAADKDLAYGSFKKGFYDKSHKMSVFVQMDNTLVTVCHLTGAEMTAILLHEIGHNFDYTVFKVYKAFSDVIGAILDALRTGKLQPLISLGVGMVITGSDLGREVYMTCMNLDDIIGKALPPVGMLFYGINVVRNVLEKFLTMVMSPINLVMNVPVYLLQMPISYLLRFFARKSETYADSFAAVYGYGPEISTGLDKLSAGLKTFNNAPRGLFVIFDNITLAYGELVALAIGGHGSNQQRALRMLDALKRELNDPNIDPATKKACMAEIDRLQSTYDAMVNLSDDERRVLTKIVRKTMDSWYKSMNYSTITAFMPEATYAK